MKPSIYITGILTFLCFNLLAQKGSFTAVCNQSDNLKITKTTVSIQNDSVIIESDYLNQCCPRFSLQLSETKNDMLYVTFIDTSSLLCDCMCNYNIRINAGPSGSNNLKINFNGKWYSILPSNYHPLIETNKTWNNQRTIVVPNNTPTLIEQTIEPQEGRFFCWNGKKYFKVKSRVISPGDYVSPSDTVSNYIREENGKVYYLDTSKLPSDGCEEALLYDFTLEVGDTVYLGFDSIKYMVVPISTKEIQGRKCMALADLSQPYMSQFTIWIEGIGDTRGLFQSIQSLYVAGASHVLTCCHVNNSPIYVHPDYPNCGNQTEYLPLIEEGKLWTHILHCYLENDTSYTVETEMSSDKVEIEINSRLYYPYGKSEITYFKEINGKVYYVYEDTSLVYDFTLNEGNTVVVGKRGLQSFHLKVDSVNYLKYFDDVIRKTMYLSGDIITTWVEGIGDINAPLDYWFPLPDCGCNINFVCCKLNGNLIYQNPIYPNCTTITTTNPPIEYQINIFPNPAGNNISIEGLHTNRNFTYKIFNLTGQVKQVGILTENIQLNLKDGIYLLQILDNANQINTEKLVIKKNVK